MDLPELCRNNISMQSSYKVTYSVYLKQRLLSQPKRQIRIWLAKLRQMLQGKFEINFVAKPFENTSKEQLPILNTLSLHPLRIVMRNPKKQILGLATIL
jgi:hypothetical protein